MSKKDKKLQKALAGRTKIGPKAIANIKADLGIKGGIKSAAQNLGIKIKSGSSGSSGSSKSGGASVPSSSFSSATGLNPAVFDYQSALNLVNAQGNIDTQIANINSDASRYISELQVGGAKGVARIEGRTAKDVAKIQAGSTRYVADRELESNLGVENIRAKGAVNLQKIVNAGMERVENVRGEFGVQGKKIDRSTAILGGLVSAFNF